MSAINVGEVYYFLRKQHSRELSESWRHSSQTLPVTIEVPSADEIWDAALLKGCYPIAYADAFAAALAQKYRCPLVTGDPEFRLVENLELEWLGAAQNSGLRRALELTHPICRAPHIRWVPFGKRYSVSFGWRRRLWPTNPLQKQLAQVLYFQRAESSCFRYFGPRAPRGLVAERRRLNLTKPGANAVFHLYSSMFLPGTASGSSPTVVTAAGCIAD